MIAPSPYGRPPRDPAKRTSGFVSAHPQPHWSKVRPAPGNAPCSPDDLDRDLVGKFLRAGRVSLCELMDGLRPVWAWEAYNRCLDRGWLAEDDYDARVSVTPPGREGLSRAEG